MRRLAVLLLVVVAGAVASCGDDHLRGVGDAALAPPSSSAPPVPLADARAASVDIGGWGCGPREQIGSGSWVDGDLVVTAAHVVAGSDELRVVDVDGREVPGAVVHFDPDLDVALVRTAEAVGRPIELRDTEAVAGERGVLALLRRSVVDGDLRVDPELVDVEVLRPARINTTDIYRDAQVQRAGFELEADVEPGDSGALVVLPGGGAGIVWSRSNRDDRRAWAVDLPEVVLDPQRRAQLTDPVDTGPCLD